MSVMGDLEASDLPVPMGTLAHNYTSTGSFVRNPVKRFLQAGDSRAAALKLSSDYKLDIANCMQSAFREFGHIGKETSHG